MLIPSAKIVNKFISTIRILLVTIALFGLTLPLLTSAQTPPPASEDSSLSATATPDELFYKFSYGTSSGGQNATGTNIGAVNAIATTNSWQIVLANVVKTLLNVSGGLALIALTVGGVFMVTARGKPEQIDKGKKIVVFAVTGLIIIAVSYALVIGVSSLQFFTPGAGGGATGGTGAPAGAPAAPAPGTASAPGGDTSNTNTGG